ncbi:hypothetical protein LEMLEM_LOCUS26185 [Lemmus lemmus]
MKPPRRITAECAGERGVRQGRGLRAGTQAHLFSKTRSVRPLPQSTRTRARILGRAHTHARKSVAAARSTTLWGALRGAPLPPVVVGAGPASRLCCQTGRGLGLVQPPGQHLLDSFIQVTPELPGIFEAPSLPSQGTRGSANGLVTCSPESYGRALGNLYPSCGEEEERGEPGGRVGGGGEAAEEEEEEEGRTKNPGLPAGG